MAEQSRTVQRSEAEMGGNLTTLARWEEWSVKSSLAHVWNQGKWEAGK